MKRPLALLLAGLAVACAACGLQKQAARAEPLMDVFRTRAQAEGLTRVQTDGKRLFSRYCATCHGETGQGDGQNAYNLDPQPPDFRESLRSHPPAYWRQIVEGGSAAAGRSALCPPWGRTLSRQEIDALVGYLRTLATPSR